MKVECTELDVLFFVLFVAIFAYCLGFWILQQFELDSGKWSWGFGPNFQRGWRIIWPGNHCMVLCFALYRNIRCRNVLEECIHAVLRLLYMCSVKRCGEEPWLLQRWSYWREHLKYVWNVYCDVTNRRRDHHTRETTGNERFPICHGTNYFHFVLTFSLFTSKQLLFLPICLQYFL